MVLHQFASYSLTNSQYFDTFEPVISRAVQAQDACAAGLDNGGVSAADSWELAHNDLADALRGARSYSFKERGSLRESGFPWISFLLVSFFV